jgi:hypothetical protein
VLATWAPATAVLPLPLDLSALPLCRIVAHIVAARPTAAKTVQHLPCGLGPSDLWLVSVPLPIVRAATKRQQCRRNTGAVHSHMWYRRCCPLSWRCCCHRDDMRCRCDNALGLSWCRSTRFVRGTYKKPLRRGLSNLPRSSPHRVARRGAHAFPFSKLTGCKFLCGVGCQIRRQAGHGAANSLATYLEAAELIPRLAEASARISLLLCGDSGEEGAWHVL